MTLCPVILAGGSGTRLWPLSRELYPKQFLTLTGERSLLQETLCRLDGFALPMTSPIIVCNEAHRFIVGEHVRQLGVSSLPIILEPDGRNTAPALTLAALLLADACQAQASNDPVMLVMPSDHAIKDVAAFQSVVCQGAEYAASGCLVTFGVTPTSPKTEYGYIHKGASLHRAISNDTSKTGAAGKPAASKIPSFRVSAFVEKPNKAAATSMLETGEYLWNSGIFMMRMSVWLDQLKRHRSDIAAVCTKAYHQGHKDGDFYRPEAQIFAACPSDSIDYAVMEKIGLGSKQKDATPLLTASDAATHEACVVLTLDVGWSDLGAWSTWWEEGNQDSQGNVIQGEVYPYAIRNSLIIAQHRLVAAIGLDDIVIVETADAVLAVHKDHVQEVKSLVARLKAEGRAKLV